MEKEIIETIGVLREGAWNLELNRVSWNGGSPKFDLRKWDKEHEKCSKGITLGKEELERLSYVLDEYLHGVKMKGK